MRKKKKKKKTGKEKTQVCQILLMTWHYLKINFTFSVKLDNIALYLKIFTNLLCMGVVFSTTEWVVVVDIMENQIWM